MLLFVGLGNPTPDSENNRHNVGFKIIDSINKKFSLSKQKPKFKGLLTTGIVGDQKVYAIKPLTFMNNSGICIRELIEYFKIDPEDVVVFHDDLDVEFGKTITSCASILKYSINSLMQIPELFMKVKGLIA
jgi:PTH1 family peptidyl-tRNA hydrolase